MEISEEGMVITCVFVGDAGVGKTALIQSFITDFNPVGTYHRFTRFADYYDKEFQEENVILRIFDPVGNADDIYQEILHQTASVFVICFSLVDRSSFASAITTWYRHLRFHCVDTPVIPVGTKLDEKKRGLVQPGDRSAIVTKHDGVLMMRGMCAEAFVECSAETTDGVPTVFVEVLKAYGRANSFQIPVLNNDD